MTTPHSGHLGCSAASKRSMSATVSRYATGPNVTDGSPQAIKRCTNPTHGAFIETIGDDRATSVR